MSERKELKLLLESSRERLVSHVHALLKDPRIKAALRHEEHERKTPKKQRSSRQVA
jgi:hypothetical protein